MRGFADLVARRWHEPDAGIWEIRDDAAHHVHSKLMALARPRPSPPHRRRPTTCPPGTVGAGRTPETPSPKKSPARASTTARGTYTRSYGSTELDAALLVLPLLGIEQPDSPRIRGTIDAIAADLSAGGPLLYRYPPGQDGLPGTEGAFLPCSFWLVQALARTNRTTEAINRFEALLGRASPLGLYAEEMDPTTDAHLGNYPQALTHAALIQAALALRDSQRGCSGPE